MIYDLIEATPKLNKKKVAIVSTIAVLVVFMCVMAGIKVAKHNKTNIVSKNIVLSDNNNALSNTEISNNIKLKHIASVNMNPVYTDVGKDLMSNIYHSQEKVAYLTFDDGPSKSVTPLILDLLKQENIKATFFVLGNRAKANPDVLKREYLEGHYIANHGYSHIYGEIYSSVEAVLDEYNRTRDIVREILGTDYDGHLFRFPGGSTGGKYKNIKTEAKTLLADNNIAYIDWNSLSSDAAGAKTKEAIIQNTIDTVGSKNSVVILMHDAGDKILTYEVLPEIIQYLKEKGYSFKNFYNIMK